jgi:hypothetical protein
LAVADLGRIVRTGIGEGNKKGATMESRKLAAVALASGVFGGMTGALATAATQSSASPQAIAAAVQRVSDTRAHQQLAAISSKLVALPSLSAALSSIDTDVKAQGQAIASAVNRASTYTGQDDNALYLYLQQICRNTAANGYCQYIGGPTFR